jgi:transposase
MRASAGFARRICIDPQHQTAPLPPQPIDQGRPKAGLLAHVITSRYADHLPLHRLEGIPARLGVTVSRSTMYHGMAAAAPLLTVLYDRMLQRIRLSAVIPTDDTEVRVLDPRLNQTRQGRLRV